MIRKACFTLLTVVCGFASVSPVMADEPPKESDYYTIEALPIRMWAT